MKEYICIDIGGTSVKYGVLNEKGSILCKNERLSRASEGAPILIQVVKEIIRDLIEERTIEKISGICISTAGMVDPKKGEIIYAGKQVPEYQGTNWKRIIAEEFGLVCEVENDVNCAGLAESMSGSAEGSHSCICLTIGTGIGGCLIEDGHIFHGHSNSAFEIGYMNVDGRPFQDQASATALIHNVSRRKKCGPSEISGKYIFTEGLAGDIICIEEIDRMVDMIAKGISTLCYIVNPEVVVLGGGVMKQKSFLEEKVQSALQKYLLPNILNKTKISFAMYENDAGMIGAFYHFINEQKK